MTIDALCYVILALFAMKALGHVLWQLKGDAYEAKMHARIASPSRRKYAPSLTVVVYVYNHSDQLEGCFESIFLSEYPGLRIVAVETGSSDDSYNRLRAFQRKYGADIFKIVRRKHASHRGLLMELAPQIETRLVMQIAGNATVTKNTISNGVRYFRNRDINAVAGRAVTKLDGTLTSAFLRLREESIFSDRTNSPEIAPVYFTRTAKLRYAKNGLKSDAASEAQVFVSRANGLRNYVNKLGIFNLLTTVIDIATVFSLLYLFTDEQLLIIAGCATFIIVLETALSLANERSLRFIETISLVLFSPFAYVISAIVSPIIVMSKVFLGVKTLIFTRELA